MNMHGFWKYNTFKLTVILLQKNLRKNSVFVLWMGGGSSAQTMYRPYFNFSSYFASIILDVFENIKFSARRENNKNYF